MDPPVLIAKRQGTCPEIQKKKRNILFLLAEIVQNSEGFCEVDDVIIDYTAVHMREQRELKISLLTKDSREGK
jgi:hypothetical protein